MALRKQDFEAYPPGVFKDETDVNLRAYFTRMDEAKLAGYDAGWSDERVVAWDDNFRSDGALMIVCCERDVGIAEYREVLELYREFREKMAAETASRG